jgi:hypothetical protein
MACLRSFRHAAAAFALLVVAPATSTRAEDTACSDTKGIVVQDARLLIVPNTDGTAHQLTLSGIALVTDARMLSSVPTHALCVAAIGENFQVNKNQVCNEFYLLTGGDVVKSSGNGIEFSLSQRVPGQGPEILLARRAGGRNCSSNPFIVEVQSGAKRRFLMIDSLPKSLNDDRVEFEIASGVDAKDLNIQVVVTGSGEQNFNPPTSWQEPIKGLRLERLGQALLLSLLIALIFAFLERSHPFPAAFGQVSTYLRSPITAAMAFYMTGALTEGARNIISVIGKALLDSKEGIEHPVFQFLADIRIFDPFAVAELAVLAAILVAVFVIRLLLALPARALGAAGRVMVFPFQVTIWAAVIGIASVLLAMLILKVEGVAQWLGFETPALIVSFLYALIGVGALRRLFDLSGYRVFIIGLIVTVAVLFPTDAVLKSAWVARIGDNTRAWAIFLSSFMAIFIFVAALTGFAFRVARSEECRDRLAGQWLIFLLILLVAAFSIAHPTNALAVAGLMLVSSNLLLPQKAGADGAVPRRGADIDWEANEESFPFVVGGVAAFIFVVQFAFAAAEGDFYRRFALLDLANVPRTFALGAVAGLVLARVGPSLRGDSAVLKAAYVSAVLLVASVAASLVTLKGHFVAVLTANFGVVAALIICALVVYDLPRVRNTEGSIEWRDLFKGTTLGQAVPFLSAMAVAVFSALSPIFMHELTNSVGTLLRANLTQVQSSEDARKAQQSQSPVPRPQNPGGN